MEAAGRHVGPAAELAAGMQFGEDDLDPGQPGLLLGVDRDAAPVIDDLDRAVVVQGHLDVLAVTTQCLVDRVVDDLPQAMHQAARVGGTDVHAGTLANCFQALQYEQVAGVIGGHEGSRISAGTHRTRRSPRDAPNLLRVQTVTNGYVCR